jgi:uncharacterized protein (TIGR02996 family)
MNEEQLLQQIALSPFDSEPRQVYADFLAEQGDPRAEVIALSARGSLTMAERRRVAGIVRDHSRRWLGPLEAIADPAGSHFVGGFLETLVLAFNARPAELLALRGEPRLATVRNLEAAVHRKPEALGAFLRQPMLSNVTRLVLASPALPALEGVPPPFTLEALGIADNGLFVECLRPLERIRLAPRVGGLPLASAPARAVPRDPGAAHDRSLRRVRGRGDVAVPSSLRAPRAEPAMARRTAMEHSFPRVALHAVSS